MNILFLGYWGVREGLSVATIYPHLEVLSRFSSIDKIIYCSIERGKAVNAQSFSSPKVQHIPLNSSSKLGLLAKVFDFTYFPWRLKKLVEKYEINFLICRGAPAGIIGHILHSLINIPYAVESFEPHADYMLESGVWNKRDPRYLIERWGEKAQKESAKFLLPVAEGYRQKLISEGVRPGKLFTLPCTVDTKQFAFDSVERYRIRHLLNLKENDICGIYVGKFGGLYFDEEAFELFHQAFQQIPLFYLVILSPENTSEIRKKCEIVKLPIERVLIKSVSQKEVSAFLSASDFGFALYKPGTSKRYLSPIKIGEYWASGLPVILTEGIGDESRLIKQNHTLGILLNQKSVFCFEKLLAVIQRRDTRDNNSKQAKIHRGRERIFEVYNQIFKT